MPAGASEPYNSAFTRETRISEPSLRKRAVNWRAARIGPTVWELEGPMPILKRSKMLVFIWRLLGALVRPAQYHFAGVAGAHGVKALFEFSVVEAVRDDRRNIQTRFEHDRHFVPGLIHLAAVDALDGEHVEDDVPPVDRHFFCRDAKHGYLCAVAHVGDHVTERRWIARHLQANVEALLHAQLLLRIGDGDFLGIDGERRAHLARQFEADRIRVRNHH